VNTGPAVVGNVGSEGRRSFAVIGDTINTASRLLSLGRPGQVVVADATWNGLGGGRRGTALGSTPIKGRRRPVTAWILESLPD
jgi:class 3 adenylate cyclase